MDTLNKSEIAALHEALDDEHLSWATYDQVVRDFGEAPPFSNIRDAEARHIAALHGLYTRYGLPIPENPWPGKVERYTSRQAACEAGVAGETANAIMYDRLLVATERADILTVLRKLQAASQERHLPAFQRCAEGGGGRGGAGGGGAGGGGGGHGHGGRRHRGGQERA